MISWDALTPDPDYRRRQQDLGLRRAVVLFNDRAVPGLGNLWFSMPVAWALLGLKIAADRNLNAVTVTNAIEALAMKAAHSASSGAVDKTVGSRLRGHRKLALVDDLSYASLSRRGAYVSQPLRQMLQQPLDGLGLASGGRFATLELASDVITLLEGKGKPLKELLDALDAWVGGKGSGKKPPVADSISPLVSVPRPLAIKLRSRLFEEGRPEDLARRRSVRDAHWLDETRADARVFAEAAPRPPFDAEHWRDLRAGSALLALRYKALLLLRDMEGALLDARQAGLLCGFTAGRDTVNRIKRRFSPDMSHPKLALLIHPTKAPVTDVPGVIWCHVTHDPRARGFDLLHAKLALLGFRHRETGAYRLRLVVSTGNWTHEPLSTSIDCFWSCETTPDQATLDDAADLRRAWDVFQNLRAVTAPNLLQTPFDGHLPDAALKEAITALPQADPSGGRLIDNRKGGLLSEFVSRLAKPSRRRRATKVVMGAGYYQSAVGTDFVPKRVLLELVKAGVLESNCRASLIANPESCQSLVERVKWLTSDGWSVYAPEFSKHRQGEPKTPRKLHAKFILLGGDDLTTEPASLYLGSGNLTERGIIDPMSPHGNLEAGVVIRPDPALGWRGNKSTRGLTDLLPIARAEERRAPIDLVNAAAGDDFERPEEPDTLPAVTWLIWNEGNLSAPGHAAVRVRLPDGGTDVTPCDGLFPCPEFVTLDDSGLAVPVLSDGVLSTRPRARSFDEVLKGLRQFPEPPDADEEEDYTERTDGTGPRPPGVTAGSPLGRADTPERPYPIRRMMSLLVALTDRQRTVLAYDWDRWCRELRSDLSGIAASEEPTIAFFRCSGVDPLPILLDPLFLPDGAELRRLENALDEIRAAWGLEGCPSLWDDEDAV